MYATLGPLFELKAVEILIPPPPVYVRRREGEKCVQKTYMVRSVYPLCITCWWFLLGAERGRIFMPFLIF